MMLKLSCGSSRDKSPQLKADKSRALFQRSLAELRYLGFIKASRKKTDHVAKLAWKGL